MQSGVPRTRIRIQLFVNGELHGQVENAKFHCVRRSPTQFGTTRGGKLKSGPMFILQIFWMNVKVMLHTIQLLHGIYMQRLMCRLEPGLHDHYILCVTWA